MNSKAPQRVSSLARFCNKYTSEHFNIALGVLEYLLQTSDVGIRLDKVNELKLLTRAGEAGLASIPSLCS